MRRLTSLISWLALIVAFAAPVQAQTPQEQPTARGSRPTRQITPKFVEPFRSSQTVITPPAAAVAEPARDGGQRSNDNSRRRDHDGHRHHHQHHSNQFPGVWPWGGYQVIWPGSFGPGWPVYYPDVIEVAPQFSFVPTPAPPVRLPNQHFDPPAPAVATARRGQPRETNAEQKAKANKFIGFGDGHFAAQKYPAALDRYKLAARTAPDLAEPYLRQGHALVALGQYESATKAFKRGLRIQNDWDGTTIRLDQMYGVDRLAKTGHLEALAKEVEDNPLDTAVLWALGMQMYFDGQQDNAVLCFTRLFQLGDVDAKLLRPMMSRPGPAGVRPPAAAVGGKVVF